MKTISMDYNEYLRELNNAQTQALDELAPNIKEQLTKALSELEAPMLGRDNLYRAQLILSDLIRELDK
jgi:hypothetical protein